MKKYVLVLLLFLSFQMALGQTKFNHIMITNDDGIEDADRLIALARSVKNVASRVSIIVSAFDRSGTSNHSVFGKYQSTFEVRCEYLDKENNTAIYTLPANPADCVYLGLSGFFGEARPDLVLSGINSGPNIGPGWFGSGTIGAARAAAYRGVKAIAFSGFNDDNEKSFSVIPDWIKEFISSGFIDEMEKNSYLTVGFPRIPLERIKGVKLVERRISYDYPELLKLKKIHGRDPHRRGAKTIWTLGSAAKLINSEIRLDEYHLSRGFIVITPMTINENNSALMNKLTEKADLIPHFYKK